MSLHVIKGCSIKRCPDCDELAAHDREIANAAAKKALLDACKLYVSFAEKEKYLILNVFLFAKP